MPNYFGLLAIVISLNWIFGCATFHYPPIEKELFSWQIPKSQVEAIKKTILNAGYERISKDNYFYEGALVTQYAKEITINRIKSSRVQIMLNFMEANAHANYDRNLGISIFNLDRHDIPEINNEVYRIENILYNKLIEVAGKENVVRGKR